MTEREKLLIAYELGYRGYANAVLSPLGRILSVRRDKRGYYRFTAQLFQGRNGRCSVPVHRLVAFQKYGEKLFSPGILARHLDGNTKNNLPSNIAIGTQSDNMMDQLPEARKQHALVAAAALRKLSKDEIVQLRQDRENGMSYKELGKKYGIVQSTAFYIVKKKTYNE